MRIAIIHSSLASLSAGHSILDKVPDAELHIFEESAELGLIGEGPGLVSKWPILPNHWLSKMGSQEPNQTSTAIRRSWLERAMATSLCSRGCVAHLRTRVEHADQQDGKVRFTGAGRDGRGTLEFDQITDFREATLNSDQWFGGVCLARDAPDAEKKGIRSDGTAEVWWREEKQPHLKLIQKMEWSGIDPSKSVEIDIEEGIAASLRIYKSIFQ